MLLHLLDMQERSSSSGAPYGACSRPRSRSLRRPLVTANSVLHTLQLDWALEGSKLADQLAGSEWGSVGGGGRRLRFETGLWVVGMGRGGARGNSVVFRQCQNSGRVSDENFFSVYDLLAMM